MQKVKRDSLLITHYSLLESGFTFIELLMGLGVVTILTGFLLAAINPLDQIKKARDSQRKKDLEKMQTALEDYYNDRGYYPPTFISGASFAPYLAEIPSDPQNEVPYVYYYATDGSTRPRWYKIYIKLEYEADPVSTKSGCETGCGPEEDGEGLFNYWVSSPNVALAQRLPDESWPWPPPGLPTPTSTPAPPASTPTSIPTSTPAPTATPTLTPTPTPGFGQTVEVRVAVGSDDAEESDSGNMYLSSGDLELVYDGSRGNQIVGMRFNGLTIPQGANIANAYVQFQVDETNSGSTSLTVQGEDVNNASTFTSSSGNISSRPRTSANASWSPVPWTTVGEAGPDQRTPNIASVVQEIVNRSGWSSGNSLVIIITGTGERTAESYDGVSAAAPLLHVEYGL